MGWFYGKAFWELAILSHPSPQRRAEEGWFLKKASLWRLWELEPPKVCSWRLNERRRSWKRWKGAQHEQQDSSRMKSITMNFSNIWEEVGKARGSWRVLESSSWEGRGTKWKKFALRWGEQTRLFILRPGMNTAVLLPLIPLASKCYSSNGDKTTCQARNKTEDTTTSFIPVSRVATKQNYFVNILLLLVISTARELLQVKH